MQVVRPIMQTDIYQKKVSHCSELILSFCELSVLTKTYVNGDTVFLFYMFLYVWQGEKKSDKSI